MKKFLHWLRQPHLTKIAVTYLTYRLRKDPSFYYSYQANIAMCMYYELVKAYRPVEETILPLCNKGARRFLDMWIKN